MLCSVVLCCVVLISVVALPQCFMEKNALALLTFQISLRIYSVGTFLY